MPLGVPRRRLRILEPGRIVGDPDVFDRPDPRIVVEGGDSQHQISALRMFRENVGAAGRAKAPEFTRRRLVRIQIVLA